VLTRLKAGTNIKPLATLLPTTTTTSASVPVGSSAAHSMAPQPRIQKKRKAKDVESGFLTCLLPNKHFSVVHHVRVFTEQEQEQEQENDDILMHDDNDNPAELERHSTSVEVNVRL
jgi:hypothetical protein